MVVVGVVVEKEGGGAGGLDGGEVALTHQCGVVTVVVVVADTLMWWWWEWEWCHPIVNIVNST